MTGKIRMLSEKGFGFLQPIGDPARESGHFFHTKNCGDVCFAQLKVGDVLEFESRRGAKGLEAHDIRRAA